MIMISKQTASRGLVGDTMRRGAALLLATLAATVGACQIGNAGDPGPRTVAEPSSWNFGFLPQKCEVSHTFYLRNDGSAPLSVTEIKPGCSCTSVSDVEGPVAPGDSVAITVNFKSGRYRGRVRKTTKVHTDDSETPVLSLDIRANVVKPEDPTGDVTVSPRTLIWRIGNAEPGAIRDTLRIDNGGTDSAIVAVRHFAPGVVGLAWDSAAIAPGQDVALALGPLDSTDLRTVAGLSVTLAVIGRDTTIVTVPIEIED